MCFYGCSSHKKHLSDRTKTDTFSVVQANSSKASTSKNPYYNVNFQLDLFKNHISFYGFNTIDKWELLIENDSSFTFITNGKKSVFEFSKATEAQDVAGIRYHSKKIIQTADTSDQKKSITITIIEQNYLDETSSSNVPFSVRINIEDKNTSITYSGGGFYLGNPALNDIWVLDSLNNEKVDSNSFPQGLPRLEFHLGGGRLHGFAGCSELNGSYYIVRKKINVKPIVVTTKRCDQMSAEVSFLSMLNKSRFEYSIKNLQLTLLHKDKSRMVFKKVD